MITHYLDVAKALLEVLAPWSPLLLVALAVR